MKYEIQGGNLPVVICHLEEGEQMTNESGAMAWMSNNMKMETSGGGSLGKAIGRMFSGEKIFRNIYTAEGGEGMIAFNSSFPGSIVAVEVTPDNPLVVQKSAFLASTMGLETKVFFNKKVGVGLFGGEGFIMQEVSGTGTVFIEVDGSAVEYELASGETMIVDSGCLAMMDETCQIDIQTVKGVKNVLFGGEGLFVTKITGPGKLTLQTMPITDFAAKISQYMPHESASVSSSSSSDKK